MLSSFSNVQRIHFHFLILWINYVWEEIWSRKETSQFIIHILKRTSSYEQLFPKCWFNKIHHFKWVDYDVCTKINGSQCKSYHTWWHMRSGVSVGKQNIMELLKQWENYRHHKRKPRSLQSLFLWKSLFDITKYLAS